MAKGKAVSETLVIPEAVQEELTLLRGFRDLVAERTAYMFGAKELNAEIKDKTAEQRKAFNEASKYLKEHLEEFVKNGDYEGFKQALQVKAEKSKVYREARKQAGQGKVNKLRKGIRYIDNVAIPDSLKELGVNVQPRFSLSDWIKKAVETKKRR